MMPSTLLRAFDALRTPALLESISDSNLVFAVDNKATAFASGASMLHMPRKPVLTTVTAMNGCIGVRAIEALHMLARCTAPAQSGTRLFPWYRHWGVLRYLDYFALASGQRKLLKMNSEVIKDVVGNQRRVVSEELGIAFGALLAMRWAEGGNGSVPTYIVDIDVALTNGLPKGVRPVNLNKVSTLRPDYLIIRDEAGTVDIKVAECKGSKSKSQAIAQLARATYQLAGVRVSGSQPSSLAVATVVTDDNLFCYLLDPPEDHMVFEPAQDSDTEIASRSRISEMNEEAAQETQSSCCLDILREDLVALAIRASRFGLAAYVGQPFDDSPQIEFTPYGKARGSHVTVGTGSGWSAVVGFLLDEEVHSALKSPSSDDLVAAQRTFAEKLQKPKVDAQGATAYSAMTDGSILSIKFGE